MPNQFLVSVTIFSAATLPVWVLYRIAVNVFKKRRAPQQQVSFGKELLLTSFFLYTVCVLALTVVPLPYTRFRNPTANDFNLVPLINTAREFAATLTPRTSYMTGHFLQNILGNIALFMPLGALLPLLSEKFRSPKKVVLFASVCSVTIEFIQYVSKFFGSFRSVDIDDVILNTLGAFLGFVIYSQILERFFRPRYAAL